MYPPELHPLQCLLFTPLQRLMLTLVVAALDGSRHGRGPQGDRALDEGSGRVKHKTEEENWDEDKSILLLLEAPRRE